MEQAVANNAKPFIINMLHLVVLGRHKVPTSESEKCNCWLMNLRPKMDLIWSYQISILVPHTVRAKAIDQSNKLVQKTPKQTSPYFFWHFSELVQ